VLFSLSLSLLSFADGSPLDHHPPTSLASPAAVLENPDQQTKWYFKYFLGKYHRNFVGHDAEKGAYALSLLEERSFGRAHRRAILWTRLGPKRLCTRGCTVSSSTASDAPSSAKQALAHFGGAGRMEKAPKEVRREGGLFDKGTMSNEVELLDDSFALLLGVQSVYPEGFAQPGEIGGLGELQVRRHLRQTGSND